MTSWTVILFGWGSAILVTDGAQDLAGLASPGPKSQEMPELGLARHGEHRVIEESAFNLKYGDRHPDPEGS